MLKLVDDIVIEMMADLGMPDTNTEIATATASRLWTTALARFNSKVGVWMVRSLMLDGEVQNYNMRTILPASNVRDVKRAYFGDATLILALSDLTFYYNTSVSMMKDYTVEQFTQRMKLTQEREIAYNKPVLSFYPAPIIDETAIIITQEDYTETTLDDDYEPIVTTYAEALCDQVIARARLRRHQPFRNGDNIISSSNKERLLMEAADKAEAKFDEECDNIIKGRMALL